jgi:hypothetical protein
MITELAHYQARLTPPQVPHTEVPILAHPVSSVKERSTSELTRLDMVLYVV